MKLLGIDVSSYQGKPDWKKVSKTVEVAILRVHQKTGIDTSFEHNYKGATGNGVLVGVYKYSYAETVAEAEKEADAVLSVLNGRHLDFPVFYDLEWSEQRKLGKNIISKITKAFLNRISKAGYKTGIYCNVDWYKNVLDTKTLNYDYWLAAYPYNDNGTVQERLKPSAGIGWQYSSKGTVEGISGPVDMNLFYTDYKLDKNNNSAGSIPVTTTKTLWEKCAELMAAQTGYMEKATEAMLDDKTANAGSANYTKYARDVNSWGQPGCQGRPWCAEYQFWIDVLTFGLKKALAHMGGGFYNCEEITKHAKANGTWHKEPKLGALVIFRNGSHIERVTKVTITEIYTNGGNTSRTDKNVVIANGGMVCDKVYSRNCKDIDGYVWIDYETTADAASTATAKKLSKVRKFVGRVIANGCLNVRSWAGTDNPKIKKYPVLNRNDLVDVCDTIEDSENEDWYYVRIANKYYGFVCAEYIARQ